MSILFHSLNPDYSISKQKEIKGWLNRIIKACNNTTGDINIIFVNDKLILEMNQKYLKHNYYTDIITFNFNEGKRVSGDLYISMDRVKQNANKFNTTFQEEILRVIVHGVLHLLGYDDKTKLQKQKMRLLEKNALNLFLNTEIG